MLLGRGHPKAGEQSVCFVGGRGHGKFPSWAILEEAELLEAKADLRPALMGKERSLGDQR